MMLLILTVLTILALAPNPTLSFPLPFLSRNHPHPPLSSSTWQGSRSLSSKVILPSSSSDSDTIHKNPPSTTNDEDEEDPFTALAAYLTTCLLQSDLKRNDGTEGAAAGWTGWIDEGSAYRLRCCLDSMDLSTTLTNPINNKTDEDDNLIISEEEENNNRYLKWIKATPSPLVIDLTKQLHQIINSTFLVNEDLNRIDTTRSSLLNRLGLRMMVLPSGCELNVPISTPPGGMAFGKLLYGGVTRCRLLSKGRRAGERTAIRSSSNKEKEDVKTWLMYGGPQRMYRAVDMGPAAVLEVVLLPRGLALGNMFPKLTFAEQQEEEDVRNGGGSSMGYSASSDRVGDEMALGQFGWDVKSMFRFVEVDNSTLSTTPAGVNEAEEEELLDVISGKERNDALEAAFVTKVGGLQTQIQSIVRRVVDGRVIRATSPSDANPNEEDEDGVGIASSSSIMEAEELASLGLTPVRGLLLYGPPGCGKTALAREIAKHLKSHPPKIVSAPELLDQWVGGSEKLVRELFYDAEQDAKQQSSTSSSSALHIIVIDEIDAVFRKRTSSSDSGSVTRASVVNQILSKLDGVSDNLSNNVLLIGMTNRRELLDDALLRPGRLEVQVCVPMPDEDGRREILRIHFEALRRGGRLSVPLCRAIDGNRALLPTIIQGGGKRERLQRVWENNIKGIRITSSKGGRGRRRVTDLASERVTGGFSGADIAGLVRCAGSIALARCRKDGSGVDGLLITLEDVMVALDEVQS